MLALAVSAYPYCLPPLCVWGSSGRGRGQELKGVAFMSSPVPSSAHLSREGLKRAMGVQSCSVGRKGEQDLEPTEAWRPGVLWEADQSEVLECTAPGCVCPVALLGQGASGWQVPEL